MAPFCRLKLPVTEKLVSGRDLLDGADASATRAFLPSSHSVP